jgi:AAA domain
MSSEIVSIDSLEARPPSWVWEGYLVRNGINLIVGAKGVGKTSFACWLAARASSGDEGFGGQPMRVFIDSQEDDPEVVLRPRVEAAGAEMALIDTRRPGSRPWKFPKDVEPLGAYLDEQERAKRPVDLIILDSLSAYVPRFTTPEKADDALELLTHVCQHHRCALVFVHHFNKNGRTIEAAIGGAGAVTRIARSVFILGTAPPQQPDLAWLNRHIEPEGESDEQALVLACQKLNLAAKPPALRFLSTTTDIPTVESVHRLELLEETDCTALAVFEQLRLVPQDEAVQTELDTAITWLLDYLKDGPRPTRRAIADANADGISNRTFERARAKLKCESLHPVRLSTRLHKDTFAALSDEDKRVWWVALPPIPDAPPEEWNS